jgi:hypothetical protein
MRLGAMRAPYRTTGSVSVVLFLCVCILSQMFGVPITLVGLFTSAGMLTETVSEEFSLPSTGIEPDNVGPFRFHIEFLPSHQLPVFVTSVFHPPHV